MGTAYKFADQSAMYFLTLTVVDWVDVFSRKKYRDILIQSLDHCRRQKGLKIWSFVIMTNHVHLIVSSPDYDLSDIIRDFKSFTAKDILKTIQSPGESRRSWMLNQFYNSAKGFEADQRFKFWFKDYHAKLIDGHEFLCQKLAYVHDNPVRAGWVEHADEWLYSSQRNYSGKSSLLEIDLLDM